MSYTGAHFSTGSCVSNHRCTRPECVRANRLHRKARRVERERGGSQFVDTGPVREHIRRLRAGGVSCQDLCTAAGVSDSMLRHALHKPKITWVTAARILAADPDPDPRRVKIDAAVTWRQIRALVALGYPVRWIRGQIGAGSRIQAGRQPRWIDLAVARKIADLAARVGDTPGPSDEARRYAARHRWLVPAWYDDDWQPCVLAPGELAAAATRRDEIRELVAELYAAGWACVSIAYRLQRDIGGSGTSYRAVHRHLRALGLPTRQAQRAAGEG
jgi:lambda repressor-like predicted transcriptional regulator